MWSNKKLPAGCLPQVISPGKAVRPQLAKVTWSTEGAFRHMQKADGTLRPFVVETKFDGAVGRICRAVCDVSKGQIST